MSSIATSAAIDAAVQAGLLRVDGEQVRASHPLLALAVEQRSCASLRRAVRNALAGRDVTHVEPDPRLAATRAAQASAAAARSERLDAVHLAEQALRLTPAGSPLRGERLLALADHLALAGEPQRLRDLLTPELGSLPAGPVRARAWLLLSEPACHASRDWDRCEALLDAALAESAGDPAIRASVLLVAGPTAPSRPCGSPTPKRWRGTHCRRPPATSIARHGSGWRGRVRSADLRSTRARARRLERVVAARLVWRGEVRRAYELLGRQLALADERGEPVAHVEVRAALCDAALRAGDWSSASQLLDEWAGSSDGELLPFPIYERLRALLAAGRGLCAEAQRWATEAVGAARARGARWDEFEALRARGTAHLLADEAAAAVACLGTVWSAVEDAGIEEPGAFPVGPDLVEALLTIGDYPRARAVVDRLRTLADRQAHPWARVSAAQCDAFLRLATGAYDEHATAEFVAAIAAYEELGLRFDAARAALRLGRAQRRHRKWGASRRSLERAAVMFDELGSPGWVEQARSGLSRVGAGQRSPDDALTPSERRAADLAARGHSNREIARTLHVTVHTVEAHLGHVYAKLGVRSRTQLVARFASR